MGATSKSNNYLSDTSNPSLGDIKMVDKQIPKLSGSGVTIGGSKTLEEYLDEQEAKEDASEYAEEGKKPKYFKPRSRYKGENGKSSITRLYTRREINEEHWKEYLMNLQRTNLSKTAQLDRAILQILLSGKEIIGKDLAVLVMEALPKITKKSYDIRASHLTRKTDLARVIEIRRIGNNNCFKLVTPALDLTAEELHTFAYKDPAKRHNILRKHKGLRPYFEPDKKEPIQLPEQPKKEPEPLPDTPKKELKEPEPTWSNELIGQAISRALGIEVNVSGKIEFVFKLGE